MWHRLLGGGDTGLRQHAAHGEVVYVQLPGERADRPVFGVVEPQDLRLELARDHRHTLEPRTGRDSSAPAPGMKPGKGRQRPAAERTAAPQGGTDEEGEVL